ncbi:MAG TPA: peptide ABC transporter substrate-binding protein [Tepidisphaeraceae bacterium]|nr:peptide ABC transporter substrate-binding protein [Tepidisphaeraceae bacterium]
MTRLAIIPTVLLAMLAGAIVWSNKSQGSPADFTFINRGENKTLDIGVMSWMQDIRIAYGLWEGLYTLDPESLKPVKGCADRIDISPDQTVYTFHIRDNAKWTNGDDLKSSDFVFGWRRMMEQPGEYSYLFEYVKGVHAYMEAYPKWKEEVAKWGEGRKKSGNPDQFPPAPAAPPFNVGVRAIDNKTLKVTLEHPVAYFPALCAYIPFFPQYEPCMRDYAQKDETGTYVASYDQRFTRPPNLVSNGPYRLGDWTFKRRLRMVASDYYWNRSGVKSRVIDQLYSEDGLAAYRMYRSREVDWVADVDGDLAADLLAKGRTDLKLIPAFGTYFYDLNCNPTLPGGQKNPFADRRVRRALAMAIDKTPIVKIVTRTGEPVATTYIPRGVFPGYPSPAGIPYDLPEAKRLLAEAGYPDGVGFPHLTILFNNDFAEHGDIAQIVRRQWQVNLGIDLSLEGAEIKVYAEHLHQHEFAVARGSWYGDYDDPSTFTDVYKSSSENNNPAWKSPEYDALLQRAELETDPAARLKILAQAENLFLEDAPIIPLFQYVGRYLIQDNVHGVPLDPRQMIMLQSAWVEHR